jgi:hypothetical protein
MENVCLHGAKISPQMNDTADISPQVQKVVRIHSCVRHLQRKKQPDPKNNNKVKNHSAHIHLSSMQNARSGAVNKCRKIPLSL